MYIGLYIIIHNITKVYKFRHVMRNFFVIWRELIINIVFDIIIHNITEVYK